MVLKKGEGSAVFNVVAIYNASAFTEPVIYNHPSPILRVLSVIN